MKLLLRCLSTEGSCATNKLKKIHYIEISGKTNFKVLLDGFYNSNKNKICLKGNMGYLGLLDLKNPIIKYAFK